MTNLKRVSQPIPWRLHWPITLDHVYFVHPATDILVDISTDTRLMYWSTYRSSVKWYIGQHIGPHSVDMLTDMCQSTYWPTYRSSMGRCVNRQSTDMLVDMLTESGCPIVGWHVDRYVDRYIGQESVYMSTDISVEGCTKYTWSETLAYGSCSHSISRSPKLPLMFL